MTDPGRLLIVAPHATRTGSTRVLIDLLTAVTARLGREVAVQVASGGAWLEDLTAFGPPLRVGEQPIAVLYNSVLSLGTGPDLPAEVTTMVYVHESAEILETLSDASLGRLRSASIVLCLSDVHRQEVIASGVDVDRTVLLPPVVSAPVVPAPADVETAARTVGLSGGQQLVFGCGEASSRKGTDLFLETIGRLAHVPNLQFAWAGRRLRSVRGILDHDTEALGLEGRLVWLGDVASIVPYLASASLLLMPSRTDPQPLVPLEAAAMGVATAGFHVGGLVELADAGAAVTVPYPDTVALAHAAEALLADPVRAAELASRAEARRLTRQAPELVAERFLAIFAAAIDQDAPVPCDLPLDPDERP